MLLRSSPLAALIALSLLSGVAAAQVHYFPDHRPWRERAESGPDAVVRGWYYNLGITGLRVELVEDAPTHLVVRHVFEGSPAARGIEVDDHIVGAAGARFAVPHENGYGMEVFGARGPIADFAAALDATLVAGGGKLALTVLRDGKEREVTLRLDKRERGLGETFPVDDPASAKKLGFLRDHLVELQQPDGSWGHEVHNLFAGLSLISSRDAKHRKAAERAARYHARTTAAEDEAGLVNWRYMTAGIVLAEYYLATNEAWVLPELQEVYAFLHSTQYVSLEQLKPSVKQSHPDSWPTTAAEQHGGWGHNPGFEGYGPIAMLTGEGAIAFALMERAGIEVDRERHAAAYAFLERGTGKNGYVWYADDVAGDQNWADMGRTGAAGVACRLARFDTETMRRRSLLHASVIGEHPESFPDTHGSPILGMGFAAAAAWSEPSAFAALMRANRWWFVLSECADGTFYYQPNRDNAGYGADSRLSATAAVAFILSIPERRLVMTGSEATGAEKEGATK